MHPAMALGARNKLELLLPCLVFAAADSRTLHRTIVHLLNEHGVEFDHFDILEDEEVRQGLKKFSNWPTYPQVSQKAS